MPEKSRAKETLKNGRGKFLGFAKSVSDCKTKYVSETKDRVEQPELWGLFVKY